MADEGAQLGIQQEINKVLQERQAIMAASSKQLQDQTQIAIQLCAALKCESLDGITEQLEGMQGALTEAADAAEKPKNSLEQVGDAATGLSEKLDATKVAAVGAGVGLISGFKNAVGTLSAVGKGITGIIGSLGNVGKTILATPFKLMSGLVGMAQGGGGGPSPIREEMEAIRGEFGSLASNEGKAVASSLGQVQSQMGDLAGTGLSVAQVYGPGAGGVAAAMKDVHELATAIGPGLSTMTEMFQKSAVELSMYRKGLGMTADQQAMMLKQASMAGKDPVDEMNKFASMAINMGEQFGVNAKVVGKSMSEMASDVANFGQLSVKELGKAAIYTEKLGIKTKELQGVISKFDNFEDAAKGAGEMAQAFGMNVDAMELMNAQNPAERLSMLQKSFKETGKSVEDMSRQELKMLASQSGLSEEAAKLAFSQKGMSMSYDDISKGGDKAEKKQLSQAEAMDKLADSIQKMTGGGGGGQAFKGFFDAFLTGFGDGIKKSKEFRKMMKNIRKSLKVVFKAGKEVGKAFVDMFPGVKQLMGGIADLFDPKRFKALMKDVVQIFKDFFGDLSKDPVKATEKFIEKIKGAFGKFFNSSGGAAGQVAEGGKKILKALGGIFTGLLSVALKGLTNLIKNITEKIKNPPELKAGGAEGIKSFGQTLMDSLKALVPPLVKALIEMGKAIFVKFKPEIIKIGTALLVASLSKMFLVAALSAAKGAIMGKVGSIVAGAFGKMMGGVSKNPVALKGATQMGKGLQKGGGMGKGFGGFIKGFASIKITDILKAALKLSIMAVTFIPVVMAFAFAAVQAYKVIKSSGPLKVAAGMMALVATVVATKFMADAGSKLNPGAVGKAIVGLAAGAVMLVVGAYAFGMALQAAAPAFDGVEWKKVPIAMIGLAISAGAAFGLSVAGAAINPGLAGTALLGLLAGAVLLSVGALAFGLALKIVAPAFDGVDWKKIPMAMLGMAISAGAAFGLAVAGAAIAPIAIPGMLGLVAGALLLTVGGVGFGLALRAMSAVMPDNMAEVAQKFLLLAMVIGVSVPMAIAAALLAIPAVIGLAGLLTGSAFLTVGGVLFSAALSSMADSMAKIDMATAAKNMGFMTIVMLAAVPMALAAALLTIPAVAGLIGLLPAAGFLFGVAKILGPAMEAFQAMPLNAKKVGENALALAGAMGALVITALTAVLLVPFAVPFIGGFLMKKGIKLIGDFMTLIATNLVGPLAAFAAMPIPESAQLGKKIDLINAGIEGVGTIGNIAIGLAQIDTAAVEEGGQQGGTINAITNFINVLLGGITNFITAIADLASSVPSDSVGTLKAISGILVSLGGLFKAFSPSDAAMEAVKEAAGSWGGDEVGLMNSIAQMQKDAMAAAIPLFDAAGQFISTIVDAVDGVDVSGAGPILNAIPKILTAVGSLMKSLAPSEGEMAAVNEATNSWGGDEVGLMNAMNDRMVQAIGAMIPLIESIGGVFGDMITNHLTPMISVIGSLGVDEGVIAAVADIIGALMGAMSNMLQAVGPIMEMFQNSLEDNYFFGPSKAEQMNSMMNEFGAMMGMMAQSFTDMLPMITKFITGVVAIAQGIQDPKKMADQMKVIATAISLLGDVTGPMVKAMDMLMKYKSGSWSSELNWYFGEGGFLDKMIESVGRGLASFFTKLKTVMATIKNPEVAAKQMEVISTAISLLGEVTGPMIKAMEMIKKYFGEGNTWNEEVAWYFGEGGFLDKLINATARGIVNFFAQIQKIDIKDPTAMKMKMEILTMAIKIGGDMMGMVGDSMKMIAKNKDSSWEAELNFYFNPKDGMIIRLAKAVGQGAKELTTEVLKATSGISDPAKTMKQVEILAKVIEVAGSFASAIESMGAMAVPGKGKNKQVVDVVTMVGSLTGALVTNMPLLVNGLLDVIKGSGTGVTTLYKYRHSIKTLGDLMCSVGQFATAIEALQGLGGKGGGGAEKVLENMATLFAPEGQARLALKNIIDSMSTLPLDKLPKEAGPRLKSIVEVISEMDGLTSKKVETITETIEAVKGLLASAGDDEIKGVVNLANVLAKPGKQTLTLKTVTPHIKATFVVNIDSKKLGEAVAAEGGVVASGDGSK